MESTATKHNYAPISRMPHNASGFRSASDSNGFERNSIDYLRRALYNFYATVHRIHLARRQPNPEVECIKPTTTNLYSAVLSKHTFVADETSQREQEREEHGGRQGIGRETDERIETERQGRRERGRQAGRDCRSQEGHAMVSCGSNKEKGAYI